LYDKLIEEFSQSSLVLDFEGSDIPGIADFYKSMGPVNQPYFFVKYNELPKLIKKFKK
jgi:rRNA processing protein Gar1